MLRGGPQASVQDNIRQQQQQKQKKKLSFREPEVETPLKNHFFGGCKSKTLTKTKKTTNSKKLSASVEDLVLEDQALKIAQDVGDAFSDLSITDNEQVDFSDLEAFAADIGSQRETEIRDSSPSESLSPQESYLSNSSFKLSAKDQEFLDTLVPPLINNEMRGPSVENNGLSSTKYCIPFESSPPEIRLSSSAQHQIQLLRYQLEQQNQQTQMALHQVQLLQDQMEAESLARRKAQEQNNQLMQQNKELLSHMEKLFHQIEELERQILTLEQEKKDKRGMSKTESLMTPLRQPVSYTISRRPSNEQVISDKPTLQSHNLSATKKNPQTPTKSPITSSKLSTPTFKKIPSVSPRPFTDQNKNKDLGTKEKDTLKIGDTSPTVLSGTVNPFSSNWTLKSTDSNAQFNSDKLLESPARSRIGSFTSFNKKPKDSDKTKSTLFDGSSNLSPSSISAKKYSSSTSDLYNASGIFQRKSSLTIEESPSTIKPSFSNISLNTASKLPRYQPYTGWGQRRTSLTNETEQVSAVSKDSYKKPQKTSLFNR